MRSLRALAFCYLLGSVVFVGAAGGQNTKSLRSTSGAKVAYEEFGASSAGCLIILHGASGPSVPLYRDQASFFGAHGFHVLMPHYFDATGSTSPTPGNYQRWAEVAADFVSECKRQPATRKVFVVGYSLGSSVALAAGSQKVAVDAIAEWYGSLPDEFFYQMKGMPPLLILHGERDTNIPIMNAQQLVKLCEMKRLHCDHHFYSDQGHGFVGKALDDADQRTLSFFGQYLAKGEQTSATH
ncbi:dienelactone hydrolase family protein [Edaphobacter aggregans]|uniref:dienelactone hydrolase family protein n=1 Tax=Edaphobacter aggregans TaxID=570835 RepID=UPI0012F776DB|nr:alpha/beta fold hydrolase [Edaphobacter aggregans]